MSKTKKQKVSGLDTKAAKREVKQEFKGDGRDAEFRKAVMTSLDKKAAKSAKHIGRAAKKHGRILKAHAKLEKHIKTFQELSERHAEAMQPFYDDQEASCPVVTKPAAKHSKLMAKLTAKLHAAAAKLHELFD